MWFDRVSGGTMIVFAVLLIHEFVVFITA